MAAAALELGHEVIVISGPVLVSYPAAAEVIQVETTQEMLEVSGLQFASCDGAIGAAAPCDYQPRQVNERKIAKTGAPLMVEFIETPDVVATLGQQKRPGQWVVGFALETEDHRFRAIVKLERKHCDLMVSNGAEAINAAETRVELLAPDGQVLAGLTGSKEAVAMGLMKEIDARLIQRRS